MIMETNMRMTSTGIQRRRKTKEGTPVTYFTEENEPEIDRCHGQDTGCVRVTITGDRRYKLILTAQEIIACLLELPPGSMADAVTSTTKEFDLPKRLPEVLKQLVTGAMAQPSGD